MSKINRGKYDTRTLSTLDTFGAYFVDRYFNSLYLMSCDSVSEGRNKNVTDAYRSNVIGYMNGIAKKTYYMTAVNQIHAFYQAKSGFSSIILSEFENRILSTFIPTEYYRSFTNDQKDKVLRDIIVKTANDLGVAVIGRNMLPKIIDDHTNPMLVEQLQDVTLDILLTQREAYFESFAKSVSDTNAGDKVSRLILDKIKVELDKTKTALVEEQHARITAETDRDRALAIANALANKLNAVKTLETDIASRDKRISELIATINTLNARATTSRPPPVAQQTKIDKPELKITPVIMQHNDSESEEEQSNQKDLIRSKFSSSLSICDDNSGDDISTGWI